MSFLETWQKKQSGNELDYLECYARGKDIVIVGGGDTGCDCIATSLRQVSGLIPTSVREVCKWLPCLDR